MIKYQELLNKYLRRYEKIYANILSSELAFQSHIPSNTSEQIILVTFETLVNFEDPQPVTFTIA